MTDRVGSAYATVELCPIHTMAWAHWNGEQYETFRRPEADHIADKLQHIDDRGRVLVDENGITRVGRMVRKQETIE